MTARLSTSVATTSTHPWRELPPPTLCSKPPLAADLDITGEETVIWRGFGGCFNELGWRALSHLSAADQEAVLDRLFKPDGDLRLEFCRLPIGANDYAEDWYSHAETPGDFEMRTFSLDRDRRALLPYLKAALARCPDMTLFASPWSPPTWLKNPPVYNYGRLINDPRYLDAYATYFVKFIQAYAAEGVTIHQVHVQNEPVSSQKFPSCVITGDELRTFIGRHLGPAFERAGLNTEIWLGTINGPETDDRRSWSGFNDYAFTVLEDAEAQRYVRGVSYQWAGKNAVWRTRLAYPDLPVIQSENECGDGRNTWDYAWYIADLFHHYLAQDTQGYAYWNMVLEPGGSSTWGWSQNSLLTVDPTTGTLSVNPEYHILRHYSAFIRRGDRRLRCTRPWAANAVAFRSDAGTTVVVRNPLTGERRLTLTHAGRAWQTTLPPQSLTTLVLA